MTEPERKIARALLDEARRRQVEDLTVNGQTLCAYCHTPFERTSPARIYCTPAHKTLAWLKTDAGRIYNRDRKRRQRARKRASALAGCSLGAGVTESVAA